MLGPLATARDTRGVSVRVVPFAELPGEVRPDTRVVVTSHVSWATGRVLDTAPLAASGALLVLDGAQGLGAVPVDVRALGCDFYAASGQKWLCGPGGMGYLYANPELVPSLPAPWSGYHAMEWAEHALVPALQPDARRLTTGFPVPHHVEWSHASLDVLEERRLRSGVRPRERPRGALRSHAARPRRGGAPRAAAPRSSPSRCPSRRPSPQQAADRGHRDPLPARPAVGARLRRRVEHRGGARAAGGAG